MTEIDTRRFSSPAQLSEAAADLILNHVKAAEERPSAIMLAGGNTPRETYARVAAAGIKAPPTLRILFSDERMVPHDHPQSNGALAAPMLDALAVPAQNVLRVNTALPLDQAAAQYERDLAALLDRPVPIALGLLGLGADGHTASLFAPGDLDRAAGRLAIPVPRDDGPNRVSVTPLLLENVEQILFLVVGDEKATIADRFATDPSSTVAGRAVAAAPRVSRWTA